MKIKVLKDENSELEFLIEFDSKTNFQFLNALRRTMMGHIETFAIEDVYIRANSSALWDEYLAHRLGLLVIRAEKPAKRVKFFLKVKGPKTVYAKDIKVEGNAEIVYPETILVELDEGQEIDLYATGKWGKGIEHAKWSPCLATYRHYVEVFFDKKDKEFKTYCEKNGILVEEREDKYVAIDCLKREGVLQIAESRGYEIKEYDNKVVFYLESWGQLKKEDIVVLGAETLKRMLEEFRLRLFKIIS